MTEAEWQSSSSVSDMLYALRARKSPWRWSTRKARLFACGCCRRVWPVLPEQDQREAVSAAEAAADKQFRLADLAAVHKAVKPISLGVDPSSLGRGWSRGGKGGWDFSVEFSPQREMLCNPGGMATVPKPWGEPYFAANDARALLHFRTGTDAARAEQQAQCALLREIAGPASPPVVKEAWLVANDGAVAKLAGSIYEERAFDRLSILADALEEAGCTDPAILAHLRGPGPHCRGCWAVDLVLARE
jgi:hypothetical protein